MMEVQCDLIDLFEESTADGKNVVEIIGKDAAGFVDELLKSTRTYTQDWRNKLNKKINKKLRDDKSEKC